jgi:hypothetical protein
MNDEAKTLALLGLSRSELQELVVARLCADVTTTRTYDEDGDECTVESSLRRDLAKAVREAIDAKVEAIAEEHVLPRVAELVEGVTLQATNRWGEKRGEAKTFIEYMTERAVEYLNEKVNYDGKSRAESRSSYFEGEQTRITYLVHKHLQYSIETAMKKAYKPANEQIAEALKKTAEIQLRQIADKLKVSVTTGR